jgi:hypothetical protein
MGRIPTNSLGIGRKWPYGWRATRTWADQYVLLHKTIQFHIYNLFGCDWDARSTFTISLWIDRNRPATLTLRPFAGDLFVLYEVQQERVPDQRPHILHALSRSGTRGPGAGCHHDLAVPRGVGQARLIDKLSERFGPASTRR